MQTATAPQPAMPHSILDNEHPDPSGTPNPTMAASAPTQAVASSLQKPLEDGLKVRRSVHNIIYLLLIVRRLVEIAVAVQGRSQELD